MNAAAAALAEIDLENGGGGGGGGAGAVVVETLAYPADKRLKEKQPFTWLGAVPYIIAILAGAALFAAGMALTYSGGSAPAPKTGDRQPYHMTAMDVVRMALILTGLVVGIGGIFAAAFAADEGCCECNLPRFGPD